MIGALIIAITGIEIEDVIPGENVTIEIIEIEDTSIAIDMMIDQEDALMTSVHALIVIQDAMTGLADSMIESAVMTGTEDLTAIRKAIDREMNGQEEGSAAVMSQGATVTGIMIQVESIGKAEGTEGHTVSRDTRRVERTGARSAITEDAAMRLSRMAMIHSWSPRTVTRPMSSGLRIQKSRQMMRIKTD